MRLQYTRLFGANVVPWLRKTPAVTKFGTLEY
jgi:hypothetical protein